MYYGTVTDSETGEPVAFADLTGTTPYYHEGTNDAGEFFLSSDRLGERRKIIVSSPGYQNQKLQVPVATDSVLRIRLAKAPVSAAVPSTKTLGMVRNAIRESRKLYASTESFQGYNRETVIIDDQVYGIYEMAFNYSNAGYPGSPTALRFETVKFKNMEDKMGHRLMMLKPNHRSLFYPLKDDVVGTSPDFWQLETTGNFTYEEVGRVEYDGEPCYKIRFKQKDELVVALQSGMLYIGSETGAMRYASWKTSPDKQKYLSYTSYLQSNPMEYDVQVEDDYHEASYCLVDGQLYLRGTTRKIQILVNRQSYLQFENRLSVVGKSQRYYKDISNKNTDMLIEEGKGKHLLVKDAEYRIEPWINLGIIKPEDKLFRQAGFLHDISQNF